MRRCIAGLAAILAASLLQSIHVYESDFRPASERMHDAEFRHDLAAMYWAYDDEQEAYARMMWPFPLIKAAVQMAGDRIALCANAKCDAPKEPW